MKPFSIGEALGAPFRVTRRYPLAVFVWGLLAIAMVGLTYGLIFSMIGDLPLGDDTPEGAFEAMTPQLQRMSSLSNGMTLISCILSVVLYTAAMRATFADGRQDRFFFLRFGMDEVRVGAVFIACFFGLYLGLIVLMLVGAGLGFAIWGLGEPVAITVLVVYGIAVLLAVLTAWSRVSLMASASLLLKTFAFSEGWAMGRGFTGRLILMNVLVYLIYLAIWIVVVVLLVAVAAAYWSVAPIAWPEEPERLSELWDAMRPLGPPLLVAAVPFSFLYGFSLCLYAAPLASACRQLAPAAPAGDPAASRSEGRDTPPADALGSATEAESGEPRA